jgi:hypothetical protein
VPRCAGITNPLRGLLKQPGHPIWNRRLGSLSL